MIEKIIAKDYNNGLETKDSLSKVKAVDVAGNDIIVNPIIVAQSGGCGRYTQELLWDATGMSLMLCS